MIDAAAAGAGVKLDVVNEVSFLSTALWMTCAGLAASIMPSAFATHCGYADLVIKTLRAPRVSRDIPVVTNCGRSLSAASQSFIDAMLAEAGQGKRRKAGLK